MYYDVGGWKCRMRFQCNLPWQRRYRWLKCHLQAKSTCRILACTIDPQNSIEFVEYAAAVCCGITILYCSKTDAEEIKAAHDKS